MPNNKRYFAEQKFGRLTLKQEIVLVDKARKWVCLCDCGNYKTVRSTDLGAGAVKSCGCLVSDRRIIHNSNEKLMHQIFHGMKARCYNVNNKQYKDYGGRGITICKEWLQNTRDFIDWALNNGWQKGLAIDREDNDEGYSPDNCRFVSQTINNRNTRSVWKIEYSNEIKCLSEWCEYLNLSYTRTYDRITRLKWSIEKAFNYENNNYLCSAV